MAISLLVLLPSDLLWFLFDGFSALPCPFISTVCVCLGGLLSNPGAVFTPPGCPQRPHPLLLFYLASHTDGLLGIPGASSPLLFSTFHRNSPLC